MKKGVNSYDYKMIRNEIVNNKLEFPIIFDRYSKECKDLLSKMLNKDPKLRATPNELLHSG